MAAAGMSPSTFWHWVGGRRFALTVGAGFVHTLLLWFGKISGEQFVMLTSLTVAVYIGANTAGKIMQKGEQQ
jgi:hypothetical protein